MIDQLFMQDLARDIAPPLEPEQPATLLASGPATSDVGQVTVQGYNPDQTTAGGAFVGTRLNTPKAGQAQPTLQDREKLAIGLLDSMAGALRGAVAQTIGLPGDIRSILDMINKEGAEKYLGKAVMPTTEQMLASDVLPPVLGADVPNRAERMPTVETAQEVGTFLPAPGIPEAAVKGAKLLTKAVKATKGLPVGMTIKDVSGVEQVIEKAPKVETKAFKTWFADSKAVDEANKPIVVYHARRGDFEAFDPNKSEGKSHGTGTFFSSSPDVAATYNTSSEHSLVPAYLSLKNPVIVDGGGANWNRLDRNAKVYLPKVTVSDKADQELLGALLDQAPDLSATKTLKEKNTTLKNVFKGEMGYPDDFASTDDVARWARSQGYDGVIFKNVVDHGPAGRFSTEAAYNPSNIYVAFKPEQIKSVMNKGSFDPNDPRILYGGASVTVSGQQQEDNK